MKIIQIRKKFIKKKSEVRYCAEKEVFYSLETRGN